MIETRSSPIFAYLVFRKLSEKLRVVRESLNLESSTVDVHSQELSSVRTERDFLDAILVDESEKVRIANITGRSIWILLNDWSVRLWCRRHVQGHVQVGACLSEGFRRWLAGNEGQCIVGHTKSQHDVRCELHDTVESELELMRKHTAVS